MTNTLLLSGGGRYSDPWHPFSETSRALASILKDAGQITQVRDDVDEALADLVATRVLPDLVVVNVGLPRDGHASPSSGAPSRGLQRILDSQIPLLAMHSSSTSFADSAEWEDLVGGRWIRGTSMHPRYGPASVRLTEVSHPITAESHDFLLDDERYSFLRVSPSAAVLAVHEHEGRDHPLLWAFDRPSGGRTVYDALGHDASSYTSAEHVRLIRRSIAWLLEETGR